jgi:hypothetical protein
MSQAKYAIGTLSERAGCMSSLYAETTKSYSFLVFSNAYPARGLCECNAYYGVPVAGMCMGLGQEKQVLDWDPSKNRTGGVSEYRILRSGDTSCLPTGSPLVIPLATSAVVASTSCTAAAAASVKFRSTRHISSLSESWQSNSPTK